MLTAILISLALSVVIGVVAVICVAAKYKMKLRETNYPLDQFTKLHLTESHDIFLSQHTTRQVINKK